MFISKLLAHSCKSNTIDQVNSRLLKKGNSFEPTHRTTLSNPNKPKGMKSNYKNQKLTLQIKSIQDPREITITRSKDQTPI